MCFAWDYFSLTPKNLSAQDSLQKAFCTPVAFLGFTNRGKNKSNHSRTVRYWGQSRQSRTWLSLIRNKCTLIPMRCFPSDEYSSKLYLIFYMCSGFWKSSDILLLNFWIALFVGLTFWGFRFIEFIKRSWVIKIRSEFNNFEGLKK